MVSQVLQHIPSFGAGKPLCSMSIWGVTATTSVNPGIPGRGLSREASAGGNPHLALPQDPKGEVGE